MSPSPGDTAMRTLLVTLTALVLIAPSVRADEKAARKPNIVFIIADDMG
jgi:hypothetical protein